MRKKHTRHRDQPFYGKFKNYKPSISSRWGTLKSWISSRIERKSIDSDIHMCCFSNLCRSKSRYCRKLNCRHESSWIPNNEDHSKNIYIFKGL